MTMLDDETLNLYVEESIEHLADIENDLLAIEEAGADIDEELVNKVFRAAHSIKGGAGFMGLSNIKELSHKMENVLGMIRSRDMIPNAEIINILLMASDDLRNLINNVSASNEMDISDHIESLIALTIGSLPDEEKESVSKMIDISFPGGRSVFTVTEYDISSVRKEGKYIYLVEYDLIHDVHEKGMNPLDILNEMEKSGNILESKIDIEAVGTLDEDVISNRIPFLVLFATILEPDMINALLKVDGNRICKLDEDMSIRPIGHSSSSEITVPEGREISPPVEDIAFEVPGINEGESKVAAETILTEEEKTMDINKDPGVSATTGTDTSLRVHVSLLDSLMNLAGELVLSRNQLLQAFSSGDQRASEIAGQRIDLITSELQEAIMLTRMQPIGNVFNKFPRVVRDMAKNLGKEVELALEGKEVELDKTIIEAISDPLTHLVRNSVDHGIEIPEERRKAGKAMKGVVILKAYHEAGQVNIEIADDGKGLDGNKLAASAVAKGLLSEDQAKIMSDKEKINLIFLPGFSTAEKVTDVSGRGVGMDVVKTNLDKLGGVVDIDSKPGKGTRIRIKLPLTLAIIPSQIISTGGERYAIPQVNLEELLRIPADQVKDRIEKVGEAEVVRLRGNLLPVIRLANVIEVERTYFDHEERKEKKDRRVNISDRRSKTSDIETGNSQPHPALPLEREGKGGGDDRRETLDRRYHADSALNIVVVSTGAMKYGLVVDKLYDSEEIVVKPLGRHLKHCKGYAGATIMGDGRIALILDVAGLSRMADLTSVEGSDRAAEVLKESVKSKEDAQSLLLFRNNEEEQFAVPLGLVSRIEKIERQQIENVGGKRVIQHRGTGLPLIAIEEAANVKPLADRENLLVVVFRINDKEVGLLATSPVDAIKISAEIDESTLRQPGIMGSAIIGEHTTLMVDIFGLVKAVSPEWLSSGKAAINRPDGTETSILYAEDSDFFRNQVKAFLEEGGYNVIEAEDGVVAWDLIQEHADEISIVVTDIEMPNLDGFGLTEKIRKDERFSHLPVIGLTSLAGDDDMARGEEVGIDEYQIKLDREKLLQSIRDLLSG